MVQQFFAEHLAGRSFVGVQIRAHAVSHEKTQLASPVEWYLGRMQDVLTQDPDVHFFVSCDVPEVFARVVAAVPNCHGLTYKGAYNSRQAVQTAVADLYLLACSGYLLGPYFSSFIHLAEHLAGYRLVLETGNDEPPASVDFRSGLAIDPLTPAKAQLITARCGLDHPPFATLRCGLIAGAVRTCRR